MATLAFGTPVRTRNGEVGIVTAHNPNDSSRVIVKRWNGWQWLIGRGYDVEVLVFVDGASGESGAA